MIEEAPPKPEPEDHGQVIERKGPRISVAWIFPILAIAAAAWLFWSDWKSQGPEIEIEFQAANGLQAGKTLVFFRGVNSGTVVGVRLAPGLNKAIVKVRLKAFAADLATQGTQFWIDQPEISLEQVSGLDSIVQGNSIEAKMGTSKSPSHYFVGLDKPPLTEATDDTVVVLVHADEIPYISRGAPVYYRGLQVGLVENKSLDASGRPTLRLVLKKEYRQVIKKNSRFWRLAATSVKAGPGVLKLDVAGLAALVQGGVAFDVFETPGAVADNGTDFELWANEREARSTAAGFKVTFENGQGLLAGETQVRYLGVPVGAVDAVKPDPATGRVEVTVRLEPAYDSLRHSDTVFSLIRPRISLQGVSGLETLVSGVYIECAPGTSSELASTFEGRTQTVEEWNRQESENEGLKIRLRAADIPNLAKGTPVYFHGIAVGSVKEKGLDNAQKPYLDVVVRKEFAPALRSNARFWRMPATSVQAGPGVLKVEVAGIEGLLQGGLEFDSFGPAGAAVTDGTEFALYNTESEARSNSPPIHILFPDGQGLLAGQTQLRYLGVPVGIVETVRPLRNKVEAVARLEPGYEFLRRQSSLFTVIQAKISLQGVTGLETLVSGVYIECVPAPGGPLAENFEGQSSTPTAWKDKADNLEIVVTTPRTSLHEDSPVFYRSVEVGRIKRKALSPDGSGVDLIVSINGVYAPLVRQNTKFWEAVGIEAKLGFFKFQLKTETPESFTRGGIIFATPNNDEMGPRVKRGHRFELNKVPRPEWKRWEPSIPLEGN